MLALIVVASVRLFTSDADGVMASAAEGGEVAVAGPPDIELDDWEEEFRR